MRQKPLYIANWKMHKGPRETERFIEELIPHIDATRHSVAIAPAFPLIPAAVSAAKGTPVAIGAQTISEHEEGAYTGEVSGHMLKEIGASFVLIGHSERRTLFHESDRLIHQKLKMALKLGLLPVLCIGETLTEREAGETEGVLERQLTAALEPLGQSVKLVIAYEPVWAIGTGRVATPEMAQETHACARQILKRFFGDHAAQTPILYGGSVKPENAHDLISQEDIDGALIGGASLDVNSFVKIFSKG